MAVVSISRIQVRRGALSQNGGTMPQLAGGEFGWAVDTQQLYIGNGSTSEGAPAVGNTRLLTEGENILSLAGQYTYREDEVDTGEVARTIADRLDDRVSVRAFGVFPETSPAKQTQQLQIAVYELFLKGNTIIDTGGAINNANAPVLHIEPGRFTITQTIFVPPYTTIVGAGKDKTVLTKNGNFPMFQTISSESQYLNSLASAIPVVDPTANSVANQARKIRFEHLSLEADDSASSDRSYLLSLNNCRDSIFSNVRFKYTPTSISAPSRAVNEVGIEFVSKSDVVCTANNTFLDCEFVGLDEAVYCNYYATDNIFDRCNFDNLQRGIVLGENLAPGQTGPKNNVITRSTFDEIEQQAFLVPQGTGNRSESNIYGHNVGGASATPLYPIVSYGERGNISVDDTFERTYNLAMDTANTPNTIYYPEVDGPVFYTNGGYQSTPIAAGAFERTAFRLPADKTRFFTVEYFYTSSSRDFTRSGLIEVMVNRSSNVVDFTDNYEVTGDIANFADNLRFRAELQYDDPVAKNIVWATDIKVVNPNDEGELVIKITTKS